MALSARVTLLGASVAALAPQWFDPLKRHGYPAQDVAPSALLLAYVPGLDGSNGSPFVQWPPLAETYALRVQEIVPSEVDVDAAFIDVVDGVADFLRSEDRSRFLMGESYGGLVAAAVASRHPELVDGLILVNAATSVAVMPNLRQDLKDMRTLPIPDAIYDAVLFSKVGRKTFDIDFVLNALKDVLFEKKLDKLRVTDPPLADYYDAVLADFVQQLTGPKTPSFWKTRLRQLDEGLEFVTDERLKNLRPPVLVVAGGADALLLSDREAARLSRLVPRCRTEIVKGAGHAGTLDMRIDLAAAVDRWRRDEGLC